MHLVGGRWIPKPGRPITAVPSHTAPHIKTGKDNHALDISTLDGGETRLQNAIRALGVTWMNNVANEDWHGEISEDGLNKLYRWALAQRAKRAAKAARERARRLRAKRERRRKAEIGKKHGLVHTYAAIDAAKNAGLNTALAFALLEQESGGRNIFGHDPTIFKGAGVVTEAKYKEYKRLRIQSKNKLMQGVGPLQLTWWEFQDAADRAGGCWKVKVNLQVGYSHLAALIKELGWKNGIKRYNGSGPQADIYFNNLQFKYEQWKVRLAAK
jgi:hypothetical protein